MFQTLGGAMKLYVDCDETLVFWDNPDLPYEGSMTLNLELISVLTKGIQNGRYDVTIWSAGGDYWAGQVSEMLFGEYNLRVASKWQEFDKIPDGSYAIDNRKKEDRVYLQNFIYVFSPEEFVDNIEEWEKYNDFD